ncbi:MAG: glycosyltransferase family 1 protein [Pseudomonadota bacterium]
MTQSAASPARDDAGSSTGKADVNADGKTDVKKPDTKKKGALRRLGSGVGRLTRARQKFAMPGDNDEGLKIVVATDAWKPQVNGVVRSLETLGDILTGFGNEVLYITPSDFKSFPMPSYPEIRLSLFPNRKVAKMINAFQPDAIHIATEGPIGRAARRFCQRRRYPFTTSFHTRFAEYANERWAVPIDWGYSILRDFHKHGEAMMVATPGMQQEMEARGFKNIKLWARGVDLEAFSVGDRTLLDHHDRPVFLYVGRIAVEKSIEDFLELDLPGTKVVVGDGPQREELEKKYTDAVFVGPKFGEELTQYYQAADVFVFPSRTDTFGLVNVEALACGVPVAAYPVRGPIDILDGAAPGCGALDEDLKTACLRAYETGNAQACRVHAENFSWEAATRMFISNLEVPGFDEEFWLRSAKMID